MSHREPHPGDGENINPAVGGAAISFYTVKDAYDINTDKVSLSRLTSERGQGVEARDKEGHIVVTAVDGAAAGKEREQW